MQIDNNIPEVARRQIEHIAEVCQRIKPLVVINCITYNHEPFLRDALDGFVMQKTDFPFVAVVHEDASTDGTAVVLREYAEKYPDIILPIFEEENQYSKRNGTLGRITKAAKAATGAKYIAQCEGDDYWTNENKLQIQVDFLESHPDYSMCFHNAMVHYEDSDKEDHLFVQLETREYFEKEIAESWIVATASLCYRQSIYDSYYYKEYISSKKYIIGDYPLIRCILREGKVFGYNELMSVYRINKTGWTQRHHSAKKLIEQEIETDRIFGGIIGKFAKRNAARQSREAFSLLRKGKMSESFQIWKLAFSFAPIETLKANVKFLFKMISIKLRSK